MKEFLAGALTCPACGGGVEVLAASGTVACRGCGGAYRIDDRGVPVMLTPESEREIRAFYQDRPPAPDGARGGRRASGIRLRQAPGINLGNRRGRNFKRCFDAVGAAQPDVLIVGNVSLQWGAQDRLTRDVVSRCDRAVRLDIVSKPGVDVVADGARLPFRGGSFDIVIAQATMKHLRDPSRFVGEVHRVLRPGGRFYCEIAYLLPYHRWPGDYVRFTPAGARQLLRDFTVVDAGCLRGPGQTVADVLSIYAGTLLSFNNRYLYSAAVKAVSWCVHPLKYLDALIEDNQWADYLGQVNYYVCAKSGGDAA